MDLIIILTVCLISLIPIIYLSIYSRPCADDYFYSIDTHHVIINNKYNYIQLIKEAFKTDIQFYNTWQGLYSSAFILSLQPGIWSEQYYFLGVWLLIIIMYLCTYFFIKTVLKDILKIEGMTNILTIYIIAIILTGLPGLTDGLYWFNGAWNYIPFLFLTLLNISILLRVCFLNRKKEIIYSVFLSFIISGGNHVTSFLNIMLLFIFFIMNYKRNKTCVFSLISALIGFFAMYIAPGTSIRQSLLQSQSIISTIIASTKEYFRLCTVWCNTKWILTMISAILFAFYIKDKSTFKRENLKYNVLLLLIINTVIIIRFIMCPIQSNG